MHDMDQAVPSETLESMKAYYRERAGEYDEWFYRRGRYDRGAEANVRWFVEADEVIGALDGFVMDGDVLELAPGTGIWTERLLHTAGTITAVDASPEMIAINRARIGDKHGARVRYVLADLFDWQSGRVYDGVFFGFWISHVPLERLDSFMQMLSAALRPGGKLFFVDGRREPFSTAVDHRLPDEGQQRMMRKLNDGRAFDIVKNYYDPAKLSSHFAAHGLDVMVRETATYFLYGYGVHQGDREGAPLP
ncbi:MAG TPA: class I SAM-dependent methyltransferase [Ktedonobacteraceae bacterium]|nr:class I SAM-dependent methyltransferase [Ktedonobacteraceae bacterium]